MLDASVFARLSSRVAQIGDRLQHLRCGAGDVEVWEYQAQNYWVPRKMAVAAISREPQFVLKLNDKDMQNCGRTLTAIEKWFKDVFLDVLAALYRDVDEADRNLTVEPTAFLDGGVLHIITNGAERFKLHAFLQLEPVADEAGEMFPVPRVVWELAVSRFQKGPKPELALYPWSALPHSNMDGWTGGTQSCGLYTYKGDKYRFLVLYHSPNQWDVSRRNLLEVWAQVLPKMNGRTFLKKAVKDLFTAAVAI